MTEKLEEGPKTGNSKAPQYVASHRGPNELEKIHNDGKKTVSGDGSSELGFCLFQPPAPAESEIAELKTTLRVGQERVFTPHTELVNVEELRKLSGNTSGQTRLAQGAEFRVGCSCQCKEVFCIRNTKT